MNFLFAIPAGIATLLLTYPSGLEFPWWLVLFPFAFFVFFFATGAHISTHHGEDAIKLHNVKLLLENSHFHLYLRSHSKLKTAIGEFEEFIPGSARDGGFTRTKRLSIEAWLSRTLSETPDENGKMVSLGDKNIAEEADEYGTRTLSISTTDQTWQHVVSKLTKVCYSIIILPEQTPSLIYEMDEISKSDLLDRCLIIMPPAPNKRAAIELNQAWEEIVTALNQIKGFQLPAYSPNGLLYIPNADFSVKHSIGAEDTHIQAYGNIRHVDKHIKRFISEHIDFDTGRFECSASTLRKLMYDGYFELEIE